MLSPLTSRRHWTVRRESSLEKKRQEMIKTLKRTSREWEAISCRCTKKSLQRTKRDTNDESLMKFLDVVSTVCLSMWCCFCRNEGHDLSIHLYKDVTGVSNRERKHERKWKRKGMKTRALNEDMIDLDWFLILCLIPRFWVKDARVWCHSSCQSLHVSLYESLREVRWLKYERTSCLKPCYSRRCHMND